MEKGVCSSGIVRESLYLGLFLVHFAKDRPFRELRGFIALDSKQIAGVGSFLSVAE